jgi:hypothetical protein
MRMATGIAIIIAASTTMAQGQSLDDKCRLRLLGANPSGSKTRKTRLQYFWFLGLPFFIRLAAQYTGRRSSVAAALRTSRLHSGDGRFTRRTTSRIGIGVIGVLQSAH